MAKNWVAKWLGAPEFAGLKPLSEFYTQNEILNNDSHITALQNFHMLFRQKLILSSVIEPVFIDISADDYYKLFINGVPVAQGPAPSYHTHYRYNHIDITRYLKQGTNQLAVHVYYQGLINQVWNSGDYRQGLICEITQGDKLLLSSDSQWKYKRAEEFVGNIATDSNAHFLENIDFRLKERNWQLLDYDDSHWANAYENEEDDHTLARQKTPLLSVYSAKPSSVSCWKKEDVEYFLVDFGQEIVGQVTFAIDGKVGKKVELYYGEELDDTSSDVRVKYNLRCGSSYHETLTLSGNHDVLENYDYKAFRYVEIHAPLHTLSQESISAVIRHYPFDDSTCKLSCSDSLLTDIWTLCKNTVKYGAQEVLVNCPNRERSQYLGAATITANAHIYLSNHHRLYKKTLADFSRSAAIYPGMPELAPGAVYKELADSSLQWPMQLYTYYMHTGDKDFLIRMYPFAEGIMEHYKKHTGKDGLLENISGKRSLNVTNAFYIGATKYMNKLRTMLNISYTNTLPALQQAFLARYYRKDIKLFTDEINSSQSSLAANVLPLFFEFAPEDAIPSIVSLIREKGLSCDVYFAYFLLKGLANANEYTLMYELLTSETECSWANMLKEGATSCFEAWSKSQLDNTGLFYTSGAAPTLVIIEDLLGLKPLTPGWKDVAFTPHLPASITTLDFVLQIHTKQIHIRKRNDKIRFDVETIPH